MARFTAGALILRCLIEYFTPNIWNSHKPTPNVVKQQKTNVYFSLTSMIARILPPSHLNRTQTVRLKVKCENESIFQDFTEMSLTFETTSELDSQQTPSQTAVAKMMAPCPRSRSAAWFAAVSEQTIEQFRPPPTRSCRRGAKVKILPTSPSQWRMKSRPLAPVSLQTYPNSASVIPPENALDELISAKITSASSTSESASEKKLRLFR